MSDKFNENLREARKRAGKTQQQVADAIGIAKSTYCQYETGASEPNVLRMIAIAKVLGVTGNELLGLDPPEKTRFEELRHKYGTKRLLADMDKLSGTTAERREQDVDALKQLLSADLWELYGTFTNEEKRAFWRGIIDRIEYGHNKQFRIYFL